ncbi:MAG: formate dehydrogenase subunit beta [Betaproteobacteria bacterium]|nr:formate dehydrogenase subunit beta [Betaproteobacteria bacterium]NBT75830.1 formate dehydrogenase subunit beta [Betaproteobacteria bacterium]NBY13846.1 formate dehydrogenase subunit beta [Betaproteobacteria bacterium]NCA16103.1 formate dehydrogenase subunit beta [Betaproteobacteria bacterium]NDF04168.1 formate dehydrogenase subunit beta [Betaproteobacteria bacterium]
MANAQPMTIVQRSATSVTGSVQSNPQLEVAKLIDESKCIGCKACQVACMQWNDNRDTIGTNVGVYDNPVDLSPKSWTVMRYNEVDRDDGGIDWLIRKDGCMHCEEPGCLKACPSPGAIVKYDNGVVDFNSDNCIGCGYCVAGCPFNIPRISKTTHKAYKCSLCSDRLAVGEKPACSKACPTMAIKFGPKSEMKELALQRVTDLKERGYKNAGLYDPAGVGGTHVMYVLRHSDKPEAYNGLPTDPRISPTVSLWKGTAKSVLSWGLGLAVLAGVAHYFIKGPKVVDEHEEA